MPGAERPYYLEESLRPIRTWLDDTEVVEICANAPGTVWIERIGHEAMARHEVPELTQDAMRHMAERVAGWSNQSINPETPLLSAALPNGERFQAVMPPAAPGGGAIAIRKQVIKEMRLEEYRRRGAFDRIILPVEGDLSELDAELCTLLEAREIERFLRLAVEHRYTILLSGGTSSGKTTFLNTILKEVPHTERIITIEDTREVNPAQPNHLALVASKGDQGLARVTIDTLLQASLRLRPDRLFLGEIRGAEAYSFLRAVNTGHPGSITTVHADSPAGAFQQLALMVMQAGVNLSKAEIVDYIRSVVPIVIQQSRIGGWRGTSAIYFKHMAAWHAAGTPPRDVARPRL